MKTIYIAFANSDVNRLSFLNDEYDAVKSLLNVGNLNGDFILNNDPFVTTDKIITALRDDTFRNQLVLFLYSGHANGTQLLLEDNLVQADGIAGFLGRCQNLKLVILNGCSTAGQVDALLNQNIPVVIATSAPINDRRATQFSITFFQELTQKKSSIRESFTRAIEAAKVITPIQFEISPRAIGHVQDATKPVWGLYYRENNEALIDTWRLPEKTLEYKTNQYLENAIANIIKDYKKEFSQEDELEQDDILNRLPFTISEPIRKLLAPSGGSSDIFFDEASPDRYKMMLYAYHNTIAFVTYALLAQLWKEKLDGKTINYSNELLESIEKWFTHDFRFENQNSLLLLFNQLVKVFKDNEIPFFFTELDKLISDLSKPKVKDALTYLEMQMTNNNFRNIEDLCDKTEQNLELVIRAFGFLINYGLTSIKDISVLFYMDTTTANFDHKVVSLKLTLTKSDERIESKNFFYKTASIRLQRINKKENYLYLSPFLMDENTYTRAPRAKLCYFMAYDKINKRFYFRHVSKPDDTIQIENKDDDNNNKSPDYFPLINGQFSAFYQTVFEKSLFEL